MAQYRLIFTWVVLATAVILNLSEGLLAICDLVK